MTGRIVRVVVEENGRHLWISLLKVDRTQGKEDRTANGQMFSSPSRSRKKKKRRGRESEGEGKEKSLRS